MYLVKDRAYLSTDIIVLNSENNPTEIEGAQRILNCRSATVVT